MYVSENFWDRKNIIFMLAKNRLTNSNNVCICWPVVWFSLKPEL